MCYYSPVCKRTVLGTETHTFWRVNVFETLGYRRYGMEMHSHNAPSRRAAAAFTVSSIDKAHSRQHMIAKGRNRDDAWFAMLDSEWPARKRNFERWLAPENFDENGRSKPVSPR